jgi:hypothetical protein
MKSQKPLSKRTQERIAKAVRQHVKRYRITDTQGQELGEGEGPTKPAALRNLYTLAQMRLSPEKAEEMVLSGEVRLEEVA